MSLALGFRVYLCVVQYRCCRLAAYLTRWTYLRLKYKVIGLGLTNPWNAFRLTRILGDGNISQPTMGQKGGGYIRTKDNNYWVQLRIILENSSAPKSTQPHEPFTERAPYHDDPPHQVVLSSVAFLFQMNFTEMENMHLTMHAFASIPGHGCRAYMYPPKTVAFSQKCFWLQWVPLLTSLKCSQHYVRQAFYSPLIYGCRTTRKKTFPTRFVASVGCLPSISSTKCGRGGEIFHLLGHFCVFWGSCVQKSRALRAQEHILYGQHAPLILPNPV